MESFEPFTVGEFVNVSQKATDLECNVPLGLALIPRNFASAQDKGSLFHEGLAPTVRSLWRQAEVPETPLETEGERFPTIEERSLAELVIPTIFVGGAVLSGNEHLLTTALNVLSNYIYDMLRGVSNASVQLEVVVENGETGDCRSISYRGPVDGLERLPEIITRVVADG